MTAVAVFTVTAVSYRVWRLLAHDRIAQPIRNLWNPDTPKGELIDYFFGCPWCAGTWLSILTTLAWAIGHPFTPWDFIGTAAASAVLVGLVGDKTT